MFQPQRNGLPITCILPYELDESDLTVSGDLITCRPFPPIEFGIRKGFQRVNMVNARLSYFLEEPATN